MMEKTNANEMARSNEGTVKSYDAIAGKGLIAREGHSDVHVNRAALKDESERTLSSGDRVRFEVINGPKGSFAFGVRKLTASA